MASAECSTKRAVPYSRARSASRRSAVQLERPRRPAPLITATMDVHLELRSTAGSAQDDRVRSRSSRTTVRVRHVLRCSPRIPVRRGSEAVEQRREMSRHRLHRCDTGEQRPGLLAVRLAPGRTRGRPAIDFRNFSENVSSSARAPILPTLPVDSVAGTRSCRSAARSMVATVGAQYPLGGSREHVASFLFLIHGGSADDKRRVRKPGLLAVRTHSTAAKYP